MKRRYVRMGLFSSLFHRHAEGTERYIWISGMVCQHCAEHVTQALNAVPGVVDVDVSLTKGRAKVIVQDGVSDEALFKAVVRAGYTVTSISDSADG